jgi:hypothetical protein
MLFPQFESKFQGITRKDRAWPALPKLVNFFIVMYVPFFVLFVCKCVLFYRHQVSTQFLLNIYTSVYHWRLLLHLLVFLALLAQV